MPQIGQVTVHSKSGSELRTSPRINLGGYTIDSFLTYMVEQGGPNYITTVSTSLGGTAVSGIEYLSDLTGGSTLDLYDVTPHPETITGFYLNGQEYILGGGGNVIAITQSEYDALSSEEKSDGKLRIITDAPKIEIPDVTVVSGDSGTTYTIKVSSSAPASGTDSNIITIVTD